MKAETLSAITALHDVWSQVDSIRDSMAPAAVRPEGSFTAIEYMERYGVAEMTARRHAEKLVQSGHLDRIYCMVPNRQGHMVRTAVYVVRAA